MVWDPPDRLHADCMPLPSATPNSDPLSSLPIWSKCMLAFTEFVQVWIDISRTTRPVCHRQSLLLVSPSHGRCPPSAHRCRCSSQWVSNPRRPCPSCTCRRQQTQSDTSFLSTKLLPGHVQRTTILVISRSVRRVLSQDQLAVSR